MSQEARMRQLIADEVAAATAPLVERLEAVEARLSASESVSGPTPAQTDKRPPMARTGRGKTAQDGEPATATK